MKKNRGFSIVELLVAVAVSFIAVLAASEAYISSKQTNRIQSMQSRLTEDGRFALSMLQRTISQAGYRNSPLTALASDRIAVVNNVITLKFTADGSNQILCDGSVPATDSAQTLTIRNSASAMQCATSGGTSANWIAPSTTGSGTGTELIDFNVSLGIDTGPVTNSDYGCGADTGTKPRDCVVDKYASALAVGETAEQIMAVRVCYVLRTQATDSSISRSSNFKNCAGADIANSQNDRRLYRLFNTTISIRNK